MNLLRAFLLSVFVLAVGPHIKAGDNVPPSFIYDLIESYEATPVGSNPDSIWSYTYKDQTVFYVSPMGCCDLPSTLYDVDGKVLCEPDGGIAGVGDGKCPDFMAERLNEQLIWKDQRSGASK